MVEVVLKLLNVKYSNRRRPKHFIYLKKESHILWKRRISCVCLSTLGVERRGVTVEATQTFARKNKPFPFCQIDEYERKFTLGPLGIEYSYFSTHLNIHTYVYTLNLNSVKVLTIVSCSKYIKQLWFSKNFI